MNKMFLVALFSMISFAQCKRLKEFDNELNVYFKYADQIDAALNKAGYTFEDFLTSGRDHDVYIAVKTPSSQIGGPEKVAVKILMDYEVELKQKFLIANNYDTQITLADANSLILKPLKNIRLEYEREVNNKKVPDPICVSIMPLADGDLTNLWFLKEHTTEERIGIIRQLLWSFVNGVKKLHEAGFLHQDIACANLLWFKNKATGSLDLKLTDFDDMVDYRGKTPEALQQLYVQQTARRHVAFVDEHRDVERVIEKVTYAVVKLEAKPAQMIDQEADELEEDQENPVIDAIYALERELKKAVKDNFKRLCSKFLPPAACAREGFARRVLV